jgi:CheY-like chemotaxis protein
MNRILLIEDDSNVRMSLAMMLEDEGYTVVEAEDGEDGLNIFKKDPFDLVITDLFMPKKEGIETIDELKKEYPDVKIIAISGGGRHIPGGFLVFAKRLGAAHSFEKPIDKEEFLQAVKGLLK